MYSNLTFSRYLFTYERGDILAVFHSLKMKPIFIEKRLFLLLKQIIEDDKKYNDENIRLLYKKDADSLILIINALIENRVLNTDTKKDDKVIQHFRNNLKAGTGNIKIAYFILAEACNLACSYCFEYAPNHAINKSTIMSKETALKSIDFFEKMLTLYDSEHEEKTILFYGGEPLLNYDVLNYILKEIEERKNKTNLWDNLQLSMVTNGVLLTEEIIESLVKFNVSIAISIDGPKYITDKNRFNKGGGSVFGNIMNGIELCQKHNVPFSLSVTLSEKAIQNNNDVLKFIEEINPSSLGFNILMTDSESNIYDGYDEEAADFLIKAFKKFREKNIYEDRMMRKVKSFVNSEVYPFDCGATGANQIILSPSGKVGICHGYLEDKKFFPTTINDINFIPLNNDVFNDWSKRSPLNMKECQNCIALGICGGGCPMNAERNLGSIWDLDERFCIHAKKTLEWMIWDLYDNTKN